MSYEIQYLSKGGRVSGLFEQIARHQIRFG